MMKKFLKNTWLDIKEFYEDNPKAAWLITPFSLILLGWVMFLLFIIISLIIAEPFVAVPIILVICAVIMFLIGLSNL